MSRVGKQPITVPPGVKVTIEPGSITFEGAKGKMSSPVLTGIEARLEDGILILTRRDDTSPLRSRHGLCRTLARNALLGVTEGFVKQLEIMGVGYRAKVENNRLEMSLGYSRPVIYEIPDGIEITAEKPTLLTIRGIDKQKVGQVAEDIKKHRRPDPYKQKGIRHVGERLIKKERKAGVSGG